MNGSQILFSFSRSCMHDAHCRQTGGSVNIVSQDLYINLQFSQHALHLLPHFLAYLVMLSMEFKQKETIHDIYGGNTSIIKPCSLPLKGEKHKFLHSFHGLIDCNWIDEYLFIHRYT